MKSPNISKEDKLTFGRLTQAKYQSAKQLPISEAPPKMLTVQRLFGCEEEGHK